MVSTIHLVLRIVEKLSHIHFKLSFHENEINLTIFIIYNFNKEYNRKEKMKLSVCVNYNFDGKLLTDCFFWPGSKKPLKNIFPNIPFSHHTALH